jgi:hypothetical protein
MQASPFNRRRRAARAKKKAAIKARIEAEAKLKAWAELPIEKWSIERKVINGRATNAELETLQVEADELRRSAHEILPQLKKKHSAAKGAVTKASKNVAEAREYLEGTKRGGNAKFIIEAETKLEEAQACLEDKESKAKAALEELNELARDLNSARTLRRVRWLEKHLPACEAPARA